MMERLTRLMVHRGALGSRVNSQPARHDSLRPVALSSTPRLLDPAPQASIRRAVIASLAAIGLHIGALSFALTLTRQVTRPISSTQISPIIEVELSQAAAPPPLEEEPEQPAPVKPPPAPQPVPRPVTTSAPEPPLPTPTPPEEPPPSPAEAGKLLTAVAPTLADSDPFITGDAPQFAGGVTTAHGTSQVAVRAPSARSGGVAGGRGMDTRAVVEAPVIDRSRSPQLAGGALWDCPFPAEADMEQIDRAAVSLEVNVDPQGRVKSVTVKADPGFGFGREARRCALRKNWQPGLNRAGQPTGAVARVKVRFQR